MRKVVQSKGPNVLNLNAYTQGDVQEQPSNYTPQQADEIMGVSTLSIEEGFNNMVRDIRLYDEVLSKVAKNIQQISEEEHFITDFYPSFINQCQYQQDNEARVIQSSDIELAKALQGLQRANRFAKQQVKGWVFEYAKKTRLTEVLITENKLLRKYIGSKNKDIVKLIQAINSQSNVEVQELSENLKELRQENGVLLHHLQKIKEEVKDKKQQRQSLRASFENAQKQSLQISTKAQRAEEQQEHYSKLVALLQDSLEDAQKRKKKLQSEKERLTRDNFAYKQDQNRLQKELDACQIDRRQIQTGLKSKYKQHQSEKDKVIEQIQECTERVKRQKQLTRFHEAQITRNQHRVDEYNKFVKQLQKRFTDSQEALKKAQKQLKQVMEKEAEHSCNIQMNEHSIMMLKEQLQELEQKQRKLDQSNKRQLKEIEQANKKDLNDWQKRANEVQRQTAMKILQQKSVLALNQKEIEEWEKKIMDKKDQIKDIKAQMKEIRDNQALVVELRKKLKNNQRA